MDNPVPRASILKLFWSELDQRMKDNRPPTSKAPTRSSSRARRGRSRMVAGSTIYCGREPRPSMPAASEVQRNIVAQRVLGLPRGQ